MKSTFKLGAVELKGIGVVKDIEITQEYTAGDAMHLITHGKKFVQSLLKEMPEMMLDVEKAVNTFTEIDKRAYDSAMKQYAEDTQGKCECNCKAEEDKPLSGLGSGIHVKVASGEELPEHVKEILGSILGNITRG